MKKKNWTFQLRHDHNISLSLPHKHILFTLFILTVVELYGTSSCEPPPIPIEVENEIKSKERKQNESKKEFGSVLFFFIQLNVQVN